MYITYEEPLKCKTFTEKQMHEVYRNMVDKTEYPDFECWKTDMLMSGVFEKRAVIFYLKYISKILKEKR